MRVDFPDPAFPEIQDIPLHNNHHSRNLAHGVLGSLCGPLKIHSKVRECAALMLSWRTLICLKYKLLMIFCEKASVFPSAPRIKHCCEICPSSGFVVGDLL